MRSTGVLLPIASLPTKYGIGGFSKEAYEFVDWLKAWPESVHAEIDEISYSLYDD